MKRTTLSRLTALVMALGCLASCSEQEPPTLVIVHTNDTHSQVEPGLDQQQRPCGGAVERAALAEAIRVGEDAEALYLDAGDAVQGSPYYNIFHGRVEMECFNRMGLVASTFGNHEFDNGLSFLDSMLRWAEFPYVSCNYDVSGTLLAQNPNVREHLIVERKGVKIGITGVTCDPQDLIFGRHWEGITYTEPSTAANRKAAELKAQGCDLVILLSHAGYAKSDSIGDRYIAAQSTDIDLIIGGHSHTNLETGDTVLNREGRPVYITQTGGKMNPIGRVRIEMEKAAPGRKGRWQVRSIACDKLHPEDFDLTSYGQAVRQIVMPYHDRLDEQMSVVLGHAPEGMDRGKPQGPLGNFTADALVEAGARVQGVPMDLGLMNYGGLRAPLPQGDVTVGDLFRTYPFENTLTLCELKGEHVQALIDKMAGKKLECLSGGVEVRLRTVDHRTFASRVLVGGKPIDPERYYWIATIDYLAEGNDGMRPLTLARRTVNTGILLRDVMIQKVQALTAAGLPVAAGVDGRIVEEP